MEELKERGPPGEQRCNGHSDQPRRRLRNRLFYLWGKPHTPNNQVGGSNSRKIVHVILVGKSGFRQLPKETRYAHLRFGPTNLLLAPQPSSASWMLTSGRIRKHHMTMRSSSCCPLLDATSGGRYSILARRSTSSPCKPLGSWGYLSGKSSP